MSNPKKQTAVQKLQQSSLRTTQLEMLGDDVDIKDVYLALNHTDINIEEAVSDIVVERTIQGASTVTITVEDRDRVLLKSGRLSSRNDIEIDGLFFRLVSVEKQGSTLTLVFEDREVAVLRRYNTPIKQSLATSRAKITRAQFVLRLIREPRELKMRYIIPELNVVQPIGKKSDLPDKSARDQGRTFGIPKNNDLTIKGVAMVEEQRRNANAVLDTGSSMILPRKLLVMAMMCVIQESAVFNLTGGNLDSVGLFQQRRSQGWPASRDISRDAAEFYRRLQAYVNAHPDAQYYAAIQAVQISGFPTAYAQWRTEAERIVTAYGIVPGSASDANSQWNPDDSGNGDYEFYRGQPPTTTKANWGKESSWDCITRLANEVQWRAFFVSGVFYFISDDDLLKSRPIIVMDETTAGIDAIDGNYDEGKKVATLQVTCEMGRWAAPPGSVIQVTNMGPFDGRWLVNDISRSLFDRTGTITLKKKLPRLPEPAGTNVNNSAGGSSGTWTNAPTDVAARGKQFQVPGGMVQPIPAKYHCHIIQGIHQTAGLAGYPACDWGADVNAPVIAVENGTIVKLSGHDPSGGPSDPVMGVHGPFGWSVYLKGDSGTEYYYTHLGTRIVALGEKVRAGETIGTVGNYAQWGGANHTHVGVHPGSKGRPDITDLMNAPIAS